MTRDLTIFLSYEVMQSTNVGFRLKLWKKQIRPSFTL